MKVVHCKKEKYDVYIGRGSKWGNPFSHKKGTQAKFVVGSREEAIEKYREYILSQQDLIDSLPELKDKVLGCWCAPKSCHGDVLIELVNKLYKTDEEVKRVMGIIRNNLRRGSYAPLSKEDSKIARKFYTEQVRMPLDGGDFVFHNELGTIIARGYNRIVVGDYGPYIEFTDEQIVLDNIEQKWPGKPKREIKYIWMETKDKEKTKVYWQYNTVPYADYKVGRYYIDPRVVFYTEPEKDKE